MINSANKLCKLQFIYEKIQWDKFPPFLEFHNFEGKFMQHKIFLWFQLVSFKEEQRADHIDAASHVGAAVSAHVAAVDWTLLLDERGSHWNASFSEFWHKYEYKNNEKTLYKVGIW